MAIILTDPITQKPLLTSDNKVLLAPEIPSGAKTKQVLCLDPVTKKLMKYSDGKAVILTVAEGDTPVISYGVKWDDGTFLTWEEAIDYYGSITDTTIESYGFGEQYNIVSIAIPDNITIIESTAFGECESLASITLPKNLISLGDEVFEGCAALDTLVIPSTIQSIGTEAFYGCASLQTIEYKGVTYTT